MAIGLMALSPPSCGINWLDGMLVGTGGYFVGCLAKPAENDTIINKQGSNSKCCVVRVEDGESQNHQHLLLNGTFLTRNSAKKSILVRNECFYGYSIQHFVRK